MKERMCLLPLKNEEEEEILGKKIENIFLEFAFVIRIFLYA